MRPKHVTLGLIAGDLVFCALHLAHVFHEEFDSKRWSIEFDGGWAELFQHLKLLAVAVMLAVAAWSRRSAMLAAWTVLFAYLFVDDAFMVHEKLGDRVEHGFGGFLAEREPILGLRAQDVGELAVSVVAGLVLVPPLLVAYRRAGEEGRAFSLRLGVLLAFLVFFGVVVDMLHILSLQSVLETWLALLEDGGEMVTVSLMAGLVLTAGSVRGRDAAGGSR